MEAFQTLINLFINTPAWMISLVLGAAGVSLLTEFMKRLMKLESDKVITVLFVTVSSLASGLDYLMTTTDLPVAIFGLQTAMILGVATPIYRFGVKPLSIALGEYMKNKQKIAAKVQEIESINKAQSIEQPTLSETIQTPAGDSVATTIATPLPVEVPVIPQVVARPNTADF